MNLVVHQGFAYQWHDHAFLNREQVAYGLSELWRLAAGSAEWKGAPVITFSSVDPDAVMRMLDAPAGKMPWIALADVSPQGWQNPFDTSHLPALCQIAEGDARYDGRGVFPLDLVAATFMGLTRWEEWKRPELDQFGCHKEDASLASRQGFRDRPALDEWAVVLRAWLSVSDTSWSADLPAFRVDFSHDIDVLRNYTGLLRVARSVARKLIKERRGGSSLAALGEGLAALRDPSLDPCVRAFDTLMEFSEAHGVRSTFFFMAAQPGDFDDGYAVESPLFKALVRRIKERDHCLAWHPSYRAAEDDSVFAQEFRRIREAVELPSVGVRHHFLRWRAGFSWRRLASMGIPFDASVGYNYCLGFRASTARAYTAFDLDANTPLALEVRPLVIMDGPLQRGSSPVARSVTVFANRCARVNGTLSVLVHNYTLMSSPDLLASIASGLRAVEAA
jgi:hypothetical protein